MGDQFGLLYATPSTLEGMASVLDLNNASPEYNASNTPEQADFHALRSDWRAVGNDIREAAAQFVEENKKIIQNG